jgi:hypothetical protein
MILWIEGQDMETWKPIPGYEGRYDVSDAGNVSSLGCLVKRKPDDNRKPYITPAKTLAIFANKSMGLRNEIPFRLFWHRSRYRGARRTPKTVLTVRGTRPLEIAWQSQL